MKRITLATLKGFIRRHRADLLIKNNSDFDAMTDCVQGNPGAAWRQASDAAKSFATDNNLGISGVWLVLQSRDYYQEYDKDGKEGIEVTNCCGNFIVAIQKGGGHDNGSSVQAAI